MRDLVMLSTSVVESVYARLQQVHRDLAAFKTGHHKYHNVLLYSLWYEYIRCSPGLDHVCLYINVTFKVGISSKFR